MTATTITLEIANFDRATRRNKFRPIGGRYFTVEAAIAAARNIAGGSARDTSDDLSINFTGPFGRVYLCNVRPAH